MLVVSFVSLLHKSPLIQSHIHKLLRRIVHRLALCISRLSMDEHSNSLVMNCGVLDAPAEINFSMQHAAHRHNAKART